MAVRSFPPQRAMPPPRVLPSLHSPALQRTSSSDSASQQEAAASSSARTVGSLFDGSHSSADTLTAAHSSGKGGAGGGMAMLSSGSAEGAEAGSCFASSSRNGTGSMRSGLGARQERTASMGDSEAIPVSSSASPAQVHTRFLLFLFPYGCRKYISANGTRLKSNCILHCFCLSGGVGSLCRLHQNILFVGLRACAAGLAF